MSLYRVVLDAGHGSGRGANGNGLNESVVVLDLVKRIGHHLRASGQVETLLTRRDAAFVSLERRAALAGQYKPDLFLSVHCNACSDDRAEGVEAYIAAPDLKSRQVAQALVDALEPWGADRGVKFDNQSQHSRLYVLRETYREMRSVLLEVLFISNSQDAATLKDRHDLDSMAQAIANVVVDWLSSEHKK